MGAVDAAIQVPGPPGIVRYNSADGVSQLLVIKWIRVFAGKVSIYGFNMFMEPVHLVEDINGVFARNPELRHHLMVALNELNIGVSNSSSGDGGNG